MIRYFLGVQSPHHTNLKKEKRKYTRLLSIIDTSKENKMSLYLEARRGLDFEGHLRPLQLPLRQQYILPIWSHCLQPKLSAISIRFLCFRCNAPGVRRYPPTLLHVSVLTFPAL